MVIAHRGDSFHAPENTLEAGRLGWEAGAEAWELDVQLSRDGIPVVIHDQSLLRTTNVANRFSGDRRGESGFLVSDFDLSELRLLDAGAWFLRPAGKRTAADFGTLEALSDNQVQKYVAGTVRVPTLAEALSLTRELDWMVNVEVKSFPDVEQAPNLLVAVVDAIASSGIADQVLVSSFDHSVVAQAAGLLSSAAFGVLTDSPIHDPDIYVREVGADFCHISTRVLGETCEASRREPASRSLYTAELDALRTAGIPVLVYTINDTAPGGLASRVTEAGVSGLFTDNPRGMRILFGSG